MDIYPKSLKEFVEARGSSVQARLMKLQVKISHPSRATIMKGSQEVDIVSSITTRNGNIFLGLKRRVNHPALCKHN